MRLLYAEPAVRTQDSRRFLGQSAAQIQLEQPLLRRGAKLIGAPSLGSAFAVLRVHLGA